MQSDNPMRFFSENVDNWGAVEWFDRAAKAIRSQDKAVIEGDEISVETYRMIAASSLMTLVRDHESTVRAALEAALSAAEPQPAPSVAVKALQAIANYRRHSRLDSDENAEAMERIAKDALSAQAQDESEIVDCLNSGKPFVFDPATNFCHADDGGAPEHGIKYVPAAQVQNVAEAPPVDSRHRFEPNSKYPWFCAVCGYAPHEPLKHLPAAPAKQEGGE